MKRLLLASVLAMAAVPALPAFARDAPRCEQPQAGRAGQRSDCPPPARNERRDDRRGEPRHDARPDDRHQPRPEERAERRPGPREDRTGWQVGQTYRGRGAPVDPRRADLPPAPRGQHWIRDNGHYLLVSDNGGIVRQVARTLR